MPSEDTMATLNGYDTSLGPAHGTSFRTASSRQRALTHVYISPSSGQQGFVNLSQKTVLSMIEGQTSIFLTLWQQCCPAFAWQSTALRPQAGAVAVQLCQLLTHASATRLSIDFCNT
jgi:hypothetical protein